MPSVYYFQSYFGSVALLSHSTLKWSAILRLSFFAQCWWPREFVLRGSSAPSEFLTSLSNVLTLRHCVKVKQCYLNRLFNIAKCLPTGHVLAASIPYLAQLGRWHSNWVLILLIKRFPDLCGSSWWTLRLVRLRDFTKRQIYCKLSCDSVNELIR